MHHKLMENSLRLRDERSNEVHLRHLLAKGVRERRKLNAKLMKLERGKAREEKRMSNEAVKVKRLTLEVKHVRGMIFRLQREVRSESSALTKYGQLLRHREHGVRM